jgi:hypothetical protein
MSESDSKPEQLTPEVFTIKMTKISLRIKYKRISENLNHLILLFELFEQRRLAFSLSRLKKFTITITRFQDEFEQCYLAKTVHVFTIHLSRRTLAVLKSLNEIEDLTCATNLPESVTLQHKFRMSANMIPKRFCKKNMSINFDIIIYDKDFLKDY